jgi:hypothetical protein
VEAIERGSAAISEALSKIEHLDSKEHERLLFNTSLNTRYSDPAGTIELFREHATTDEYRTKNVVDVFKNWAKDDRIAAGAWLSAQADSKARDLMIVKLIETLPARESATAAQWAREIGDAELRLATLGKFE